MADDEPKVGPRFSQGRGGDIGKRIANCWAVTAEGGSKMTLNRRDALKLGGLTILGGAALGVPLGRGAQTKGGKSVV